MAIRQKFYYHLLTEGLCGHPPQKNYDHFFESFAFFAREKKTASAARGKASDSRQYMGGVYPHPLCETQCRGGVYPHPPSATKTYSLGCEVSIQRMVSDGCRVRLGRVRGRPPKNLLSLVYGGPLWPSAKKIYDHFFASYAPLREMKKQRVQSVMCECKTN